MNSIEVDRDLYRRWAEKQLGVDAGTDAASARSRFLKRLDGADFMPPETWLQAIAVLDPSAAIPVRAVQGFKEEIEKSQLMSVRESIEDFADRFWTLPPQERRAAWLRLRASRGEDPALAARVDGFLPGLDLDYESLKRQDWKSAGPHRVKVEKLVSNLLEWFPLKPALRAARRRDWLAGLTRDKPWKASNYLAEHQPALAALDPELLGFLDATPARRSRVEARKLSRREAFSAARRNSTATQGGNQQAWPIAMIAVVMCSFLLRTCVNSNSSRSRETLMNSPYQQPIYKLPTRNELGRPVHPDPRLFNPIGSVKTIDRLTPGTPDPTGLPKSRISEGMDRGALDRQTTARGKPGP